MLILNYSHVETVEIFLEDLMNSVLHRNSNTSMVKSIKKNKSTSIKWEQIAKDIRSKPEEQQLGVSTKRRDRSLEQQGD